MLPERLKEIYRSPKSTLIGVLAGVAGVLLYVVQAGDKGLESLDVGSLIAEATLLGGMLVGFFKRDKK